MRSKQDELMSENSANGYAEAIQRELTKQHDYSPIDLDQAEIDFEQLIMGRSSTYKLIIFISKKGF